MSTERCVQQQRTGEAENRSGTALEYGPGGIAFEPGLTRPVREQRESGVNGWLRQRPTEPVRL